MGNKRLIHMKNLQLEEPNDRLETAAGISQAARVDPEDGLVSYTWYQLEVQSGRFGGLLKLLGR